jgi:hypothetical protein
VTTRAGLVHAEASPEETIVTLDGQSQTTVVANVANALIESGAKTEMIETTLVR